MNDKLSQTQRILRSSKFKTDDHGRTVMSDSAETPTLELMSTQVLHQIIAENDSETSKNLRQLAEGESGLVARDVDKGSFEIISDHELESLLSGSAAATKSIGSFVDEDSVETLDDEDELDLVSTQMLRIALNLNDDEEEPADEAPDKGFDPYNRS